MNLFRKIVISTCLYVSLLQTVAAVVNIESLMQGVDVDKAQVTRYTRNFSKMTLQI